MNKNRYESSDDIGLDMDGEAFSSLEVALSLIPDHEKTDYLMALHSAPDLVIKESDPIRFLRFTGFHAPAAALALIRYWKGRRTIVGDKAFLPLSLAGNSALDEDVFDFIRSGVSFTPLKDRQGRSIIVYDTSRRVIQDVESRRKYFYYLHHFLMENDLSQTDGCILITLGNLKFDPVTYETLSIITNTFPIKVKDWHLLSYVPCQLRQPLPYIPKRFRMMLVKIYAQLSHGYAIHFYEGKNREETTKALEEHGIDTSSLPLALGGKWSYWKIQEWFEERKRRDLLTYDSRTSTLCEDASSKVIRLPPMVQMKNSEFAGYSHTRLQEHREVKLSAAQELALEKSISKWCDCQRTECVEKRKISTGAFFFFCRQLNRGLGQLPSEETAAYHEASSKAPAHVWEEESNPFLFLLTEDFNVFYAANRLAKYWDLRLNVYGDRSYMELNQTGEGALQRRTDLALLDTGFVSLLPCDSVGSSVVFIDTTCLRATHTTEQIQRCLFYMFSITTENPESQQVGVAVIIRIKHDGELPLGRIVPTFMERLTRSLPLTIKALHLLFDEVDQHSVPRAIGNFSAMVYIHSMRSKQEALMKMETFGLRKEGLPRCLGGTWGTISFSLWQEMRTRVEWKVPLGLQGVDAQFLPAIKAYTVYEDKVERVRRLNVIHSRRKRARRRIEWAVVEEQYADAKSLNTALRKENEKLNNLIRRAVTIIRQDISS